MKKNYYLTRFLQVFCVLTLGTATTVCMGQQKFARGQATDSSAAGAKDKAKVAAWRNYLGTLAGAKLDNITANEKVFLDSIDSIVTNITVVDETCTTGFSSTCRVSIAVTINETIVESRLRQIAQAAGAGKPKAVAQDDAGIAFLVMARVADSQVAFDAKVTKRAESTASTSGSSASADAAAGNKTGSVESSADAASVTAMSKTVTGGSTETKRDRIKYVAWPSINDLQNGVGEVLTNNNFKPAAWDELVAACNVLDKDPFSKLYAESETGDLPSKIRIDTFRKLGRGDNNDGCGLSKIILAQIEVDSYRTDPNDGLLLATGNINIIVYDLTGRFSRQIGSVTRKISGRAATRQDASRIALANAAKMGADVIVNQLNR